MNRNLRNAIVAILAPLPSIVFYLFFLRNYSSVSNSELSSIHSWCLNHPLLLGDLLFFLNVNVLFWVIGLLQSTHWIFLVGVCLTLYVIHSVDAPLNIWDFISSAICLTGIVMAYYVHEFVSENQKLKEQGKPKIPNLDTGLWQYSRHPNYLGEQLWWWGGNWSYLLGTLVKDGL